MSTINTTNNQTWLRPVPDVDLGIWLSLAIIGALAIIAQLSVYPNHDVSWILWGAQKMLDGAEWGRDIIEPNPPLAWYLAMPSILLANSLGLSIVVSFQITVIAAAFVSIFAFGNLIADGTDTDRSIRCLPMIVAAIFLLLLPYRDFGQREHLMLIAVLPYLGLVALRCNGGNASRSKALAIGVTAGLGLALKPYFLAVPFLVEITALVLVRRWSFVLRCETLAIAGTIGIYVLSIFVFNQNYLHDVVPLAQSIYWSFNIPWNAVIMQIAVPGCATIFSILISKRNNLVLPSIISASVLGFAVSCIIQSKGYTYHILPVSAGSAILLASILSLPRITIMSRLISWLFLGLMLLQGAAQTGKWLLLNAPQGNRTIETRKLIDQIEHHANHGRFLVVAVHPFPAFPTALYVNAKYVSRTNSQWFLPAVVQLRGRGKDGRETLSAAERHAREFILYDLASLPDLVIIDTNSARHTVSARNFDFLAFYREDPRFRSAWRLYREIAPINQYRLFVRSAEDSQ